MFPKFPEPHEPDTTPSPKGTMLTTFIRFNAALTTLQAVQEPIQSVVARVPGAPETEVSLPAAPEDLRTLLDDLYRQLFTDNGSPHSRWRIAADRLPENHAPAVIAVRETLYLWYQALAWARQYTDNNGVRCDVHPEEERKRVLRCVAREAALVDAALVRPV